MKLSINGNHSFIHVNEWMSEGGTVGLSEWLNERVRMKMKITLVRCRSCCVTKCLFVQENNQSIFYLHTKEQKRKKLWNDLYSQCCSWTWCRDDWGMMEVCREGGMDRGMYYWLCGCLRVTQMLHPQTRWVTTNHQVLVVCVCLCDVPDLNVSKVRIWRFLTIFFFLSDWTTWLWEVTAGTHTLIIWNIAKHQLAMKNFS